MLRELQAVIPHKLGPFRGRVGGELPRVASCVSWGLWPSGLLCRPSIPAPRVCQAFKAQSRQMKGRESLTYLTRESWVGGGQGGAWLAARSPRGPFCDPSPCGQSGRCSAWPASAPLCGVP